MLYDLLLLTKVAKKAESTPFAAQNLSPFSLSLLISLALQNRVLILSRSPHGPPGNALSISAHPTLHGTPKQAVRLNPLHFRNTL